ncbi:MAG: hypothetical protein K0R57_870 [Paenibacillaceae bacterium]|jgi:molybdenum cofactor cytidylyltransferase|nr:hypothetical protein [Paenibacillaceae bacterium]
MEVAGLYLAAGKSSRMGFSKLSAPLIPGFGIPLGSAALKELYRCGLEQIAVVVRPDDPLDWLAGAPERSPGREGGLDLWREGEPGEEEAHAARPPGNSRPWIVAPCKEADEGMSASLRCGLQALEAAGEPEAVMVLLADQPLVDADWLRELLRLYRNNPGLDYAASQSGPVLMPPVILSWNLCREAKVRLRGDRGAGALLSSGEFKGLALIQPEGAHLLMDVDSPGDLEQGRRYWSLRASGREL